MALRLSHQQHVCDMRRVAVAVTAVQMQYVGDLACVVERALCCRICAAGNGINYYLCARVSVVFARCHQFYTRLRPAYPKFAILTNCLCTVFARLRARSVR